MLIVTKSAVEAAKTVLDNLDTQADLCFRLTAIPDGRVGLTLDVERQGDQVVRHGEEKVAEIAKEARNCWEIHKVLMTKDRPHIMEESKSCLSL